MKKSQLLERVRMCVAEAGHNPRLVTLENYPGPNTLWWSDLPDEVIWRAGELVELGRPMCRACFDVGPVEERICIANLRLLDDCGISRN